MDKFKTPQLARFERRDVEVITAAFAGFFALLALVMVVANPGSGTDHSAGGVGGTRIFGVILLVFCLVWLYRCLTGSRVTVFEEGVVVRTVLRTHTFEWSEIKEFGVVHRAINANPSKRSVLTLRDATGRRHDFTSFNGKIKGDPIAETARCLNQYVQQFASAP